MSTGRIGLGFVAVGAAIAALIPVFLVLYPAAGVGQADQANPAVILPVVARNPALVVAPGILQLLGHAIGAAAMVGLYLAWARGSFLLAAATLAGVAWMAVDIVDNAMTLHLVPAFAATFAAGDLSAGGQFALVSSLTDALRLAGHFAGGLWVIGVSAHALRANATHPVIGWAGIVVGAVLAGNALVPALLNLSFLSLPIWLIAFGIAVARARIPAVAFVAEPAMG